MAKIKNDGFIEIASTPDLFKMVQDSIIPSIEIDGIVENLDKKRGKIKININHAECLENGSLQIKTESMVSIDSNIDKLIGTLRLLELMCNDYLLKNCWILSGVLVGKEAPVTILYFVLGNKAAYSLKREEDKIEEFSPVNPNLN
jgi:hypothetical protein